VPAIPLANTAPRTGAPSATVPAAVAPQHGKAAATAAQSHQDSNQAAATAAVAAAMAKLKPQQPKSPETDSTAMDNLARKVAEMRADDKIRHSRAPGTGGYASGNRGGGPRRGGPRHQPHHAPKVEVPTTDFDFESANAKFNKQDLVKEAIATGSPMGDAPSASLNGAAASETNGEAKNDDVVIPAAAAETKSYDRTASFFDNISSELRDREESKRVGGQEFRSEERKKNLETFGQGSVDGYRGGYRGRGGFRGGRGRGRGGGGGGGGFGRGRGRGGGQGGFAPRGPGAPGQAAETS
jgi:protein LSM14